MDDDELRLHIETSVEAVEAFEKTKLFTEATERDRYLWNFHSHHEAVSTSSDSQLELFMQLFWYVRASSGRCSTGFHYGYVPEATSRVRLVALIVGLPSQQTHFLAHARQRAPCRVADDRAAAGLADSSCTRTRTSSTTRSSTATFVSLMAGRTG